MISRDVDKQPIQKSPSGSPSIGHWRPLNESCLQSIDPCEIRRARPSLRTSVAHAPQPITLRRTAIYNAIEPEPSGARRPPFPPRGPARRAVKQRVPAPAASGASRPARAPATGVERDVASKADAAAASRALVAAGPPHRLGRSGTHDVGRRFGSQPKQRNVSRQGLLVVILANERRIISSWPSWPSPCASPKVSRPSSVVSSFTEPAFGFGLFGRRAARQPLWSTGGPSVRSG